MRVEWLNEQTRGGTTQRSREQDDITMSTKRRSSLGRLLFGDLESLTIPGKWSEAILIRLLGEQRKGRRREGGEREERGRDEGGGRWEEGGEM